MTPRLQVELWLDELIRQSCGHLSGLLRHNYDRWP